jgi:peptide subunit release factor 1 (eRF1)
MCNEVNKDNTIWEAAVLLLLMGLIMGYTVEVASDDMTSTPNFLKAGSGIQAILRFCLSNLNARNVGITEGKEL